MFDLPMETSANKRNYARFRKNLLKEGFVMMQKSIYCKLSLNSGASDLVVKAVRKFRPEEGLVQVLIITENQYQSIEYLLGSKTANVVDSTERVIII